MWTDYQTTSTETSSRITTYPSPARVTVLVVAMAMLTVAVLGVSGCGAQAASATTQPGTSSPPAVLPPTSQPASAADPKRFANQTLTVMMYGYDDASQLFTFHIAKLSRDSDNIQFYDVDPAYPDLYKLGFAAHVDVWSALTLCSPPGTITLDSRGNPDQPCTHQQLMTALRSMGPLNVLHAHVHVDPEGRVDSVKEIFVP